MSSLVQVVLYSDGPSACRLFLTVISLRDFGSYADVGVALECFDSCRSHYVGNVCLDNLRKMLTSVLINVYPMSLFDPA
jgi:hypothetical protein